MLYTAKYEISKGEEIKSGEMAVEAISEERAREYAEHQLEEQFPGEEGHVLLELEVTRRLGRPRQYAPRIRTSLELSPDVLAAIDRERGAKSRAVFIEDILRQAIDVMIARDGAIIL